MSTRMLANVDEWTWQIAYEQGYRKPNYPMPAIPQIHQWDYVLWCILYVLPALSDEEWEREENEWQDYLDSLD